MVAFSQRAAQRARSLACFGSLVIRDIAALALTAPPVRCPAQPPSVPGQTVWRPWGLAEVRGPGELFQG